MQQYRNLNSAMERETISKNRVSPKNVKSRENTTVRSSFFLIFALAIMLIETSCKNNAIEDDSANTTEKINEAPNILDEDFNAWFQHKEKYVETFNLQITEVKRTEYWSEDLVVTMVENITDKQRGGFFNPKGDIYIPVAALDEEIATLEEIATQMKDEALYNCLRRYSTSYGITITFHYSSSESKWNEVIIYYASDENTVRIQQEYLMDYIRGLKECKQAIIDFKAGKWSNR